MALLALFGSSSAHQAVVAQAWQCHAPQNLPRPTLELPKPGEVRRTPVGGYTLTLSWSREYCKGRENDPAMRLQCSGQIGDFGFVLHGLWPEGRGPAYPQYCRSVGVLPRKVVADNICMTPSVQLLQHEWAKHGTCMARNPESYFGAAKLLFSVIQFPDMDRLSRKPLNTAGLANAFADINDGMPANSIGVKTNDRGWLQEIRVCLGKDLKPRRCPAFSRSAPDNAAIKIWRGR